MSPAPGDPVRVGYVMSRFPKLSETFVVNEIRAVERAGIPCELFPLIREREAVAVPAADAYVRRAHYQPVISLRLVASALGWLVRRPVRTTSTILVALASVLGSRKFTVGLVGLLPKTLHNARVAQAHDVRHLHAHFAHHPALAAWIIHRLTGIPYSFTAHGHDVQVERRMLCRKLQDAAFAVAISEHNRGLMVASCPAQASKVEVLHTGVDTDALSPGAASPSADELWSPGRLRVLAVGRLEPVKGHATLVRAAACAARGGTDVDVVIVGEGPERAAVEALVAEEGVGGRVRLVGARPHHEVIDLMRSASVVVLPSAPTTDGRVEGIPVVLMEAMSLGIPVAATRLPGVVELLGADHPLLFEARDADGLAVAVARIAADRPSAAALGERGRARVLESFDIRATGETLAARFRASAGSPSAGAPTG